MSHPWVHARSSAKKWGGSPQDYIDIHAWFDESKASLHDWRHRAVRHHSEGIFEAEALFGVVIANSEGREVPVRLIGEQHVKEDLGIVPNRAQWLMAIVPAPWMRPAHIPDPVESPMEVQSNFQMKQQAKLKETQS